MDNKALENAIRSVIAKRPCEFKAYEDLYYHARNIAKEDKEAGHALCREVRDMAFRMIPNVTAESSKVFYDLWKRTLLFDAPYYFDAYMQYLEINRPVEQRFYLPRRKVLSPWVSALQDLADDRLDELFLSCPPRIGKTSLAMFYITWLMGRDSEKSNLYSAYSDVITSSFYNGVLEILQDTVTYAWNEIFPGLTIASTNAKEETLNIDRKKRYASLTCRSLYGTLNGACDCNGTLISDDLIGGIEEALNKDRLASAWSKVDNNLIPRAKEGAKLCWIGTRWSLADPISIRAELLKNSGEFNGRRFKIIAIPALNEKDESNFVYSYGVGFTTEYYVQRRASFERNNDIASWNAQYQQEPVERSGTLFEPQDMKFFNGVLPDESKLVRKFMAIDPAYGGGDFTAGPICYQYDDNSVYIADVVYSDGDKRITQPLIVQKIIEHGVQAVQIEANKSTEGYKDGIEDMLAKQNIKINITTKAAPTAKSKEMRIYDKAPEIREFYYLEEGKRSKAYGQFMQSVFSFTITGKNKNDDAADSLSQAADMISKTRCATITIGKRPF